jgi:PST family polysaccharide transporter
MLGPHWNDAVVIFRLLAPTILVFALINPTGWLLLASGMVGRSLKIALVIAPLVVTGCVIGLPYGSKGVALGYSTAMTLWVVPHLLWCFHGTAVSFRDVVLAASRPLISGIVGASLAFGVVFFLRSSVSPLATLLIGCTVLGSVYTWVLLYVMGQKACYLDFVRGLSLRWSQKVIVCS